MSQPHVQHIRRHHPHRAAAVVVAHTLTTDYEAGDARAIIARTHLFGTWDEFVVHTETI